MDAKNLARYRNLLLREKQRLINNSRRSIECSEFTLSADDLPDETDLAAHEIQQNIRFGLQALERRMLQEIDSALSRIEQGTYGLCEETGEPIELDRLRAIPWTRLSLVGATLRESQRKRFA